MKTILKLKDKISKKHAIEKIVIHSLHGNHGNEPRPKNSNEVEIFFRKKGIEPQELIQRIRNPKENIPYMENLIGPTWNVSGGKVEVIGHTGEIEASVEGAGQISTDACQSLFETSIKARDRAIEESSYSHVYECITFGFSSIEAFFGSVSKRWNHSNPDKPLTDSKNSKVSIETKILEWIPIISGGKPFDKTNRQWSDFKVLKKVRDQHAIHPNGLGQGMTYKEMACLLNQYRHGVAHLLGNLHLLSGNAIPAVIINAVYYPDVEVKSVVEQS